MHECPLGGRALGPPGSRLGAWDPPLGYSSRDMAPPGGRCPGGLNPMSDPRGYPPPPGGGYPYIFKTIAMHDYFVPDCVEFREKGGRFLTPKFAFENTLVFSIDRRRDETRRRYDDSDTS
jgi:hypothetical protein